MKEMETEGKAIGDKLCNIARVLMFMIKRGISNNKMILDLHHLMMKRGKVVRRSIENMVLNHNSSFSCKSNDAHLSFISPREYEFSCSNSPAFPYTSKRKHHHHHHHHHHHRRHHHDHNPAVTGVRKMFEMLNQEVTEASPLVLPGLGKSPLVRQLRITDSPFPLGDSEDSSHVDKEAEDFIGKFYEQLRQQQRIAAWYPG